jgi:hypothetical protein
MHHHRNPSSESASLSTTAAATGGLHHRLFTRVTYNKDLTFNIAYFIKI